MEEWLFPYLKEERHCRPAETRRLNDSCWGTVRVGPLLLHGCYSEQQEVLHRTSRDLNKTDSSFQRGLVVFARFRLVSYLVVLGSGLH